VRAPTLVLWDIDLTLVDFTGTGHAWYGEALARVTGETLRHLPNFAGRTERSITTEMLTSHGADAGDEHVERMFAELVAIADAERPRFTTLGRALAGSAEILTALAARTDVVQSLVTGNLPALAGYKLEAFDLHHHVDFEIGGYGSLSEAREDLVADAMRRAEAKHGTTFPPSSVVVIATPRWTSPPADTTARSPSAWPRAASPPSNSTTAARPSSSPTSRTPQP
jgi:phosphoglycolate phosphatase